MTFSCQVDLIDIELAVHHYIRNSQISCTYIPTYLLISRHDNITYALYTYTYRLHLKFSQFPNFRFGLLFLFQMSHMVPQPHQPLPGKRNAISFIPALDPSTKTSRRTSIAKVISKSNVLPTVPSYLVIMMIDDRNWSHLL